MYTQTSSSIFDGRARKKKDGTFDAAACLFVNDAHTLMHDCLPEKKRPPKHTCLGLSINPIAFVLLLSMMARSSEPWRLFATVLRSRKKTVIPKYLKQLNFLDPCTTEQANALVKDNCSIDLAVGAKEASTSRLCLITPAVVRFVVSKQQEKIRSQLLGNEVDCEEADEKDDDESSGVLSDDNEDIEQAAEKMYGAFQDNDEESEGSNFSD